MEGMYAVHGFLPTEIGIMLYRLVGYNYYSKYSSYFVHDGALGLLPASMLIEGM